jgi:hypothetical protein
MRTPSIILGGVMLLLALAGCTPTVGAPGPRGPTQGAAATSTPRLLTVEEARTRFLSAYCPLTGAADQVYRATRYGARMVDLRSAAELAVTLGVQAIKVLRDRTVIWPNDLHRAVAALADRESDRLAYNRAITRARTMNAAEGLTDPSPSGLSPSGQIRQSLALPEDREIACVNYNTISVQTGYPRVVQISSVPAQVRSDFLYTGHATAVALAPGVWTDLPPGASVRDALLDGSLHGFCASVKAYERRYLFGRDRSGLLNGCRP